MKKLLALVLALVMSMSLVTISNAAFKDADKIDSANKEAVEVMAAVGVLKGYENGDFGAQDELTRAQACKIVAYLDLGEKTADAIKGTGAIFTDVSASNWAAGYIEYCAGAGYVAGVGDKKFAPDEKVTGVQFAKMLLCALGYDAKIEGYNGSDYAINIARDANKNELFDDVSGAASAVLTREKAAQMAFNALEADTVEYKGGTNVSTSDGTTVVINAERNNVVRTKDDYRVGNKAGDADTIEQLVEKLYGHDLKLDEDTDAFKRTCDKWTYKADEVGKYANNADYTLTGKVSLAKFYSTIGSTVADDLENADEKNAKISIYTDGETTQSATETAAQYIDKKSSAALANTGKGATTEIYVDTDTNSVKVVIINTYVLQATEDYNSKKDEVGFDYVGSSKAPSTVKDKKLSGDDFAIEDVKEDDYLLATVASGEIKSVTPATIVTGTVTTYEVGDSVTIDGTKYEYAKYAQDDSDNGSEVTYKVGEKAALVTDGTYVYYVDDAKIGTDNYVYVAEIADPSGLTSSKKVADAYFLDGTNKTITVKDKFEDDSKITKTNGAYPSGWFKYTVKNDEYTLEKIAAYSTGAEGTATGTASNGAKLTENGKTYIGTSSVAKANSSTIYVVNNSKDDVTVYTGVKNAPTITTKSNATVSAQVVVDKNGYAKYVFVDTGDDATIKSGAKASDKVFTLKLKSTTWVNDEDKIYVYEALVNGEKTTISSNDQYALFTLYTEVAYDSDGYVDDMEPVTQTYADGDDDYVYGTGNSVEYKSGVLTLDSKSFVVADNAKLFLVTPKGSAMSDDKNADYEVSEYSGSALKNAFNGYTGISYTYSGTVDSDTDELTSLYVYVTAATEK